MHLQTTQDKPLLVEWSTLQNQYDAFEKISLLLKLFAVAVCVLLAFEVAHPEILIIVNGVLWVQDAIWKTFQSRFSDRLLVIEADLAQQSALSSIQFNTAWEAKRKGFVSLLSEYLRHLVKPTIVFPHFPLLCVGAYVVFYF